MSASPAASASRTTSASKPLVTATSVTLSGSGAAARMRSRTSATRAARSGATVTVTSPRRRPLLEERRHVELVVAVAAQTPARRSPREGFELVVAPQPAGSVRVVAGQRVPRRRVAVVPAVEAGGGEGDPHRRAHLRLDD